MKVLCLCFSPIATYIYTHTHTYIYIYIYIYIYFVVVVVVVVVFLFFCFKLALHQNVQSRLFFEKPNFLKLLHEAWDLYLAGLKRIL